MPARTKPVRPGAPAAAPALSRSPRRYEAQGAPAAMSSDATDRWARRRTCRPPGGGSPTRGGNPGTRRCGLRPRQPRSPPTPGRRTRRLPRCARSGPYRTCSWLSRFRGQRAPQLVQSRTNARLDGAERLIQPRRGFGVRKPGEEGRFDRLALVRRQRRQCRAEGLALLPQLDHIARIGSRLGQRLHIGAVNALLTVLKTQAVDRPRARLVHDPAEHRAVRGVVMRRAPPDVMED